MPQISTTISLFFFSKSLRAAESTRQTYTSTYDILSGSLKTACAAQHELDSSQNAGAEVETQAAGQEEQGIVELLLK